MKTPKIDPSSARGHLRRMATAYLVLLGGLVLTILSWY
jgi:hypothetical protein